MKEKLIRAFKKGVEKCSDLLSMTVTNDNEFGWISIGNELLVIRHKMVNQANDFRVQEVDKFDICINSEFEEELTSDEYKELFSLLKEKYDILWNQSRDLKREQTINKLDKYLEINEH